MYHRSYGAQIQRSKNRPYTGGVFGFRRTDGRGIDKSMYYEDAEALINEARRLKYKFTPFERGLIERLEAMRPRQLRREDAQSVTTLYRRAAGYYTRR